VDEEAKVRALVVLDKGAGIDEPLEAMLPRFRFWIDVRFRKVATISEITVWHVVILEVGRPWIVGQIDTNDTMSSSAKGGEVACSIEILAHKFRTLEKGGLTPYTPIVTHVGFTVVVAAHTWSAPVAVWRKEGMDPQFVVDIGGWTTWKDIDGGFTDCIAVPIEYSCTV
jgi:hypothetical protein